MLGELDALDAFCETDNLRMFTAAYACAMRTQHVIRSDAETLDNRAAYMRIILCVGVVGYITRALYALSYDHQPWRESQ